MAANHSISDALHQNRALVIIFLICVTVMCCCSSFTLLAMTSDDPVSPTVQGDNVEIFDAPTTEPSATSLPTDTPTSTPTATPTPTAIPIPTAIPTQVPAVAAWSCNCRKTCAQMASCEEAQFQLNACGCSARDGDNDGIACDSDCQ